MNVATSFELNSWMIISMSSPQPFFASKQDKIKTKTIKKTPWFSSCRKD